jgi:glucokinase
LRVLAAIAACIEDAMETKGLTRSDVAAVGLGVPGPLDPDTGVVRTAPNLNWENVPVKEILESHLHLPVFIENDVNAGTVGEHRFGAGKGVDDLIGIFVGTGIGGGLICGGQLHQGFGKVAGEIGHMIIAVKGPKCGCGNRGCFEAMASRTAIVRDLTEAVMDGEDTMLSDKVSMKDLRRIRSSILADAYRRCDSLTVRVVKRAARYCGIGVASVLNLLNPEMIILGGGVVEAFGQKYVDLVAKAARKRTFEATFEGVRIVPAVLGDDAVLLGAASLALERATRK